MQNRSYYNPDKHHRRSIRKKGHNYAGPGLYFITINCSNRACLFGEIDQGRMILNDAGKAVDNCWQQIPNHFPHVTLHKYVIMPNHIHGILQLSALTDNDDVARGSGHGAIRANDYSPLPRSPSKSIGSIIRGFKIGVVKWFRTNTSIEKVWHRNYHEHILRDNNDYLHHTNYIINNPANWNKGRIIIRPLRIPFARCEYHSPVANTIRPLRIPFAHCEYHSPIANVNSPLRPPYLILNRLYQIRRIYRPVDVFFDIVPDDLFVFVGLLVVGIRINLLEKFILGLWVECLVEVHPYLFLQLVVGVKVFH